MKQFITKWLLKIAIKLIKAGFNIMDKDKDGKLSYEEFEDAAEELNEYSEEILSKIFG